MPLPPALDGYHRLIVSDKAAKSVYSGKFFVCISSFLQFFKFGSHHIPGSRLILHKFLILNEDIYPVFGLSSFILTI